MEPDGQPRKKRFIPAGKPTLRGADGSPPPWAIGVMIAVIGAVGFIFMIGQWSPGFIRTYVPFGDTDYFWIGLIFLPMVALIVLAAANKLFELYRAQSWSQTTGKVVRSGMETRRHRFAGEPERVENVPAVEYEFMALGSKVRGSRIGIGDDSGGENAEATLARYPVGTAVTVYYDPQDPTHCVLERGGPKGLTAGGCIGALIEVVIFFGAVYWLIVHGPAFIDARFPKAKSSIVILAGAIGLVLLMFFVSARRYSKRAANWPSVRGKIVSSDVESYLKWVDHRQVTFYRPAVEFAYTVHGLDYRSNQIKVGLEVSGSQDYAAKLAAKYPAESEVDVHYDPANPST